MASDSPTPEQSVADHYGRPDLVGAIHRALTEIGKSPDTVMVDDLAPVDEFHIGGRPATARLFELLDFEPEAHVLDVGCGIGGSARLMAQRVERVTGIDLTEAYVETGTTLNRWLGLSERIDLRVAPATAMPFDDGAFDGGYMLHVGMNIEDKGGLIAELARVLRPGARFGIYDVMRVDGAGADRSEGGGGEPVALTYPVPWASEPGSSHLADAARYRGAAVAAGFTVEAESDRGAEAGEFFDRLAAGPGPSPLGLHLLMGPTAQAKVANMIAAVRAGVVTPVELVLRKPPAG